MKLKIYLIILLVFLTGCNLDNTHPSSYVSGVHIEYTVPANNEEPVNITVGQATDLNHTSIQFYPTDNKSHLINYTIYIQNHLLVSKQVVNNTNVIESVNFAPYLDQVVNITIILEDQSHNKNTVRSKIRFIYDFDSPIVNAIAIVFEEP